MYRTCRRCPCNWVKFLSCVIFFPAEDGIRGRNVTGVQTCALPISGGEKIPILGVTGLIVRADEMRFAAAPFTDYLFKPVEPSRLLATIHSYLPPGQTSAENPGKKQRVLLVDDEPAQLKLFSTYLGHLGFDVITATDGQDGLVKARAVRPDAVLSDVLM